MLKLITHGSGYEWDVHRQRGHDGGDRQQPHRPRARDAEEG